MSNIYILGDAGNSSWERGTMLRPIVPADVGTVCDLTARAFIRNEPMCLARKVTIREFRTAYDKLQTDCCLSGYSFLIHEEDSIAAVSLSLPYVQYADFDLEAPIPSLEPMEMMIQWASDELPYKAEETLAWSFIATDEPFLHRGYARRLLRETLDVAATAGFKYVIADASHSATQRLCHSQGFEVLKVVKYSKLECFSGIREPEGLCRYAKKLPACAERS
jgi:GNAT superfamily N-acetyltransferase